MKMQMYKCCCWSLKTGVTIFGVLQIIRFLFILGCGIIGFDQNAVENYAEYGNYTELESEAIDPDLYLYIPICFIMVVFSSLMIVGSLKDKYKLILPHFYAHIFIIILIIVYDIYETIVQFAYYKDFEYGSLLLAKGILSGLYDVYFCVLVFSRIKEIKGSKNVIYPLVF